LFEEIIEVGHFSFREDALEEGEGGSVEADDDEFAGFGFGEEVFQE